jgi:hypothetical protein
MHQSQPSKRDLQHLVSHWHQERSSVHTGNLVNENIKRAGDDIVLGRSPYHNLEHRLHILPMFTRLLPALTAVSWWQQILLPTLADALLSIGYAEIVDHAPEHRQNGEIFPSLAEDDASTRWISVSAPLLTTPMWMPRWARSRAPHRGQHQRRSRLEAGDRQDDNAGEAFTRERHTRVGGARTRSKARPSHERAPSWSWS